MEFRICDERIVIEDPDEAPCFSHNDLVKALEITKPELADLDSPRGQEIL
jgi:hypothetical protein